MAESKIACLAPSETELQVVAINRGMRMADLETGKKEARGIGVSDLLDIFLVLQISDRSPSRHGH